MNYFTLDWKTSNGFSDINGNQPRIGLALKKLSFAFSLWFGSLQASSVCLSLMASFSP